MFRGTMKQEMPFTWPSFPLVLAKMKQWVAECIPVCHFFDPLIKNPSTPFLFSGVARFCIWVASLPCPGSVKPNVILTFPANLPSINCFFCCSFPKFIIMITSGKFPTMLCSFCRSLNRPRPLEARCSRITAIQRLLPRPSACGLFPPYCFGRERRKKPASSANRLDSRRSASHSGRGRPPLSQSVRACSRRWSKKRLLSSLY